MAIGGKEFKMDFINSYPGSFKVELIIGSPDPQVTETFKTTALLDTGSDYTLVPIKFVRKLGLIYSGKTIKLTGFDDDDSKAVKTKFYSAKIIVEGVEEVYIEVGAVKFEPIIGRDLINRWHILLNPAFTTFEIVSIANYKPPA